VKERIEQDIKTRFEGIFRQHFSPLCYFAQKYIRDTDSCREIVHNVFIAVWDRRHTFDFESPVKSYLHTAVYNRCMNFIRDHKKFDDNASDMAQVEEQCQDTFQNNLEIAELEDAIEQALDALPQKCRQVFELNRYEGKKYGEIAQELNISVKTVEAQMSKALKILREKLVRYIYLLIFLMLKVF
jgi:RNA polymerase sigma-70 factor (ECF subfamily)